MDNNLIIMHGGGPTAVINASLYGAVREAQASPEVDRIYAAIGGTGGLLRENLRDLTDLPDETLRGLLTSPASAIGTSRDAIEAPEYEAMVPILKKYGIRYVLMNGGSPILPCYAYRDSRTEAVTGKVHEKISFAFIIQSLY